MEGGGWVYWLLGTTLVPIFLNWLLGHKSLEECRRDLRTKVVVITGASSGLGEALAHVFYEAGCKLILASRRQEELLRVKAELMKKSCVEEVFEPQVLVMDLSRLDSLEKAAEDCLAFYGRVDILINNGGVSSRGSVLETTPEAHAHVMRTNYLGPVSFTKGLLHKMVESGSGHVVMVSSVQGRVGLPGRSAYAASKHALQAYADSLRAEVADTGVKVTVVSPGYINTNLSRNAVTGSGALYGRMDSTTAGGYAADYVAERILRAVVQGDRELTIAPLAARVAIFIRTLCPSLFFLLMEKRAKKEAQGAQN